MRKANFLGFIGDTDHPNRPPSEHKNLPPAWPQNVYFIQQHPDGPIKIGVAINPYLRLATLQRMSPVRLMLVAFEEGDQPKEDRYHKRFRKHRLHGEWFTPAREIVALATQIGLPPFPMTRPESEFGMEGMHGPWLPRAKTAPDGLPPVKEEFLRLVSFAEFSAAKTKRAIREAVEARRHRPDLIPVEYVHLLTAAAQ